MAKRKKRLKKGMESLLDVIAEHEEKRRKAIEDGDLLLKEYYDKEIARLWRDYEKRKRRLEK
ncbi:hypothetical protein [Archaeoglobus sp. JdFR-39]|jgi:predicted CopG family antitoxin|uniref:hypothetical protein n=1 Tax=Archaeoglobus sp. JdFR-39 TaxID=1934996 RepID=UPI0025B92520|nr:hypothetical protein [Archaeoglobus sp. JdFR-39]